MWWLLGGLAFFWLVTRKSDSASDDKGRGSSAASPRSNEAECADVPMIPPPASGMGTGVDALPSVVDPYLGISWRDAYLNYLKEPLSAASNSPLRDFAVDAGYNLALNLRCNGYIEAANQVISKVEAYKALTF